MQKINNDRLKHILYISLLLVFSISFSQTDQPPVVTATGNQAYCPLSQIPVVEIFSITDPDSSQIDAFSIQISEGYQSGTDILLLTGNHPTITTTWSATEGKLTLTGIGGSAMLLTDLETAVRDVVYQSNSTNINNNKSFSLTVGDANYLPSTDHYYEFVPLPQVTWTNARTLAENRTYYGLQGYLATLTSLEEAQFAGEQATGTGWIGGSDIETEGVWKWVTGPEAGTIFWNGEINGTTPNFAYWNQNEPNNFTGNVATGEHYAHITDPSIGISGAWNDLPDIGGTGLYIPRGYIVEYGGLPGDPILQIAASTTIYLPEITSFTSQQICESGTATLTVTVSEGTALWFENQTGGMPIASGNSFTTPNLSTSTTYYVAPSVNGCETVERTPVQVTVNQNPLVINAMGATICSAGSVTLSAAATQGNLQWFDSPTSTTPLLTGTNFTTNITQTTTFYVEAINATCRSARVPIQAILDTTIPTFNVVSQTTLCLNEGSVSVQAENPADAYSYEWKNENGAVVSTNLEASFTEVGSYFVTAFSVSGCASEEKEIVVTASELATVNLENIIISDDSSNNSIRVDADRLGSGNYQFSLDDENGNYTSQTFYENLTTGEHTLFIRDTNGCGTRAFVFTVLNYPNFFTPNGDGENDVWTLEGFDKTLFPTTEVIIFNRFGKVIKKLSPDNLVWDGTFNGKKLPSNDYWFTINLIDSNGRTVNKEGHFSLLRR